MKRIVLILACICTLSGCSIDDDGSSLSLSLAEITDAQLPDYFETGEIYNFPINYMPANGCEQFYGFDINREINGNVRINICSSIIIFKIIIFSKNLIKYIGISFSSRTRF